MGIMALALYEDHPDAPKLIPFVEKSLGEYFKSYVTNGGGNHEGTGYWNYGMNYAMRYLLSWENATGEKHEALSIPQLAKSLYFPLDFTGVTFGDNDGWGPCCFYFMLADRLGETYAALSAAAYLGRPSHKKRIVQAGKARIRYYEGGELLYAADHIPTEEVMQKLEKSHAKKQVPVARVYDGLGWAALADDCAFPRLRLSARGGSSVVSGHGMIDLLSFKCRVGDEMMITDQPQSGYLSTTFSKRGTELYERSAASKSTLFVDGLGCAEGVTCDVTEVVAKKGVSGIRIDGSHLYLPRWKDKFIGRLFLLVDNAYWLIVDRIHSSDISEKHWLEARFHTLALDKIGKNWVSLKSGQERLTMTFASLGKGKLQQSLGMPSSPNTPQSTILRWMSAEGSNDLMMVSAMNPGAKKLGLELSCKGSVYSIKVSHPGGTRQTLLLNSDLTFA